MAGTGEIAEALVKTINKGRGALGATGSITGKQMVNMATNAGKRAYSSASKDIMKTVVQGAVKGAVGGAVISGVQGDSVWDGAAKGAGVGAVGAVGMKGLRGATHSVSNKSIGRNLVNKAAGTSYSNNKDMFAGINQRAKLVQGRNVAKTPAGTFSRIAEAKQVNNGPLRGTVSQGLGAGVKTTIDQSANAQMVRSLMF